MSDESRQAFEGWCPDRCPITNRPFFMWIERNENWEMVPTYGGPFDSYTIPYRDGDGDLVCERFDHDAGAWVDCIYSLGVQIVDDQLYTTDIDPALTASEIAALKARAEAAEARLAAIDAEVGPEPTYDPNSFESVVACGAYYKHRNEYLASENVRLRTQQDVDLSIAEVVWRHIDALSDLDNEHTAQVELKRFLDALAPYIDEALAANKVQP